MTTDTSEWRKRIQIKDGSEDLCPYTIRCADGEGHINEDDPECELTEARTRDINTTHEWVMKECQRSACDGRRWFRRRSAMTLRDF